MPRRRVVIPMSALEQAQNESIAEELGLPMDPQPSSFTPPPTTLAPAPETQPSAPAAEETDMTKSQGKRKSVPRARHSAEARASAIAMVLSEQAADRAKGLGRNSGAVARAAKKLGINNATVALWVQHHKARYGDAPVPSQTLLSPQSAPMSGTVSVRGPLPPVPTVTLQGLEEYINAIVDRRIKERLAAMLGGG